MKPTALFLFLILPYSYGLKEQKPEKKEWIAKWIGAPKNLIPETLETLSKADKEIFKSHPGLRPTLYFRKSISFENVTDAKLYCTAKGAFHMYFTNEYTLIYKNAFQTFTPGWTDYNKTIQYYTYDVTFYMQEYKENVIGVIVGPGWYSGYIGDTYNLYGDEVSALIELHLEFDNGSSIVVPSDDTWKVNTGEILYSDLMYGELFNENRTLDSWSLVGYDDSNWSPVITQIVEKNIEFVEDTWPIKYLGFKFPKRSWKVSPDTWVYGYDELIYGGVTPMIEQFPFNAIIKIRLGESIFPNGSLFTGNDRLASAGSTYVLNNPKNRELFFALIPMFKARSFRYVEVSGYPGGFLLNELDSFRYVQAELGATPTTDNMLVTNIIRYLESSTLANTNSVPTSAPSSDKRVGWLEPAGLFSSTAFNLFNARFFYKKWLGDIRNSQAASGAYSNVAPNVNGFGDASPGSGFAPILISYNLYKYYEDIQTVQENYVPNQNWLKYVISNNPQFLYTKNVNENYGDYGNVKSETPKEVISTAYFAFSSLLMSRMAEILQKPADKEYYVALHKNISSAFVKAYVNFADGKVIGDTQTGYVLALASRVLPQNLVPKAVQKLVDNIRAHGYHLTTGYVGTAFILPVLAEYNHVDVAYKLLLQESYPSWGYMFQNDTRSGLWEQWNSWTEQDGFQGTSLNSVGLGTVGNFLYQYIAGINSDEEQISFKKVVIKPYIGEGINSFSGKIETNYGFISSSWNIDRSTFNIEINLPRNTTGKLILPFASQTWIRDLSPGKQQFQFSLKRSTYNAVEAK